jgi:hypothetical protein
LTGSVPGLNLGGWDYCVVGALLVLNVACGSCGVRLAIPDGLDGKLCRCGRCGAVFTTPLLEPPVAAAHSPASPVLVTTQPLDPPREAVLLTQTPVVVQEKRRSNLLRWAWVGPALLVLVGALGYYLVLRPEVDQPDPDEVKLRTHQILLMRLMVACEEYHANNGRYPPTLAALAQQQPNGKPPLVEPDALKDPWGQPLGYDPAGPRNGGRCPDIWANRPGGKVIGNFLSQR